MKTHKTAKGKLLTALKKRMKSPGPRRPMEVINRLTDSTVHLWAISESAKWPATVEKQAQVLPNFFFIFACFTCPSRETFSKKISAVFLKKVCCCRVWQANLFWIMMIKKFVQNSAFHMKWSCKVLYNTHTHTHHTHMNKRDKGNEEDTDKRFGSSFGTHMFWGQFWQRKQKQMVEVLPNCDRTFSPTVSSLPCPN